MNKKGIFFMAIFFCACYCFYLCYPSVQENSNLQNKTTGESAKKESAISKVCFDKKCFDIEIVDTLEARAQGLMNRNYLNSDSGMLFLFDAEAKYSFWMKNTLIPLDIIWLDKNKKIVFIEHNAKPCKRDPCETFGPNEKAKYVLEINSGLAKKIGIGKGDYLEFK